MSAPEHPFGWPPIPPSRAELEALVPEWREKLLLDYEDEKTSYLSSVLSPLLEELGRDLGVLPPKPSSLERTQEPIEASRSPQDCGLYLEALPVEQHLASEASSETCYNDANVREETTRALDTFGPTKKRGCEDRACSKGCDRQGQSGEAGAEEARIARAARFLAWYYADEDGDENIGKAELGIAAVLWLTGDARALLPQELPESVVARDLLQLWPDFLEVVE